MGVQYNIVKDVDKNPVQLSVDQLMQIHLLNTDRGNRRFTAENRPEGFVGTDEELIKQRENNFWRRMLSLAPKTPRPTKKLEVVDGEVVTKTIEPKMLRAVAINKGRQYPRVSRNQKIAATRNTHTIGSKLAERIRYKSFKSGVTKVVRVRSSTGVIVPPGEDSTIWTPAADRQSIKYKKKPVNNKIKRAKPNELSPSKARKSRKKNKKRKVSRNRKRPIKHGSDIGNSTSN